MRTDLLKRLKPSITELQQDQVYALILKVRRERLRPSKRVAKKASKASKKLSNAQFLKDLEVKLSSMNPIERKEFIKVLKKERENASSK